MHYIFYPVVAGVALVLYFQIQLYQRKRKAQSLGCDEALWMEWGPLGWKNITSLFQADKANRLPQWFVDRHYRLAQEFGRTIGTFRYSLGGTEHIHTSDPKNIQAMFTTQFGDFEQGWLKRSIIEPFTGPGIFSQDGKDWEHSRIMLRPSFTRDQVGDMKRLEKHVQFLMSALRPSETRKSWSVDVDLKGLFFRLTLDSASEMLFGESIYSQMLSLPEHLRPVEHRSSLSVDPIEFAKAFDLGQHCAAQRGRLGRLGQFYHTSESKRCAKIASDFADPYVQLALGRTANEKTDDQNKPRYIFAEAIAKETRDPQVIKQQLLSIMIAGRDTTASLLSYFFRHLVRQPTIFAHLRSEIIGTFGTYTNPEEITFATLKSCSYLQNCINETLRLNTTVPMNLRIATRDTTLPSGGGPDGSKPIFVPKGRVIDFSTHVMHRRKDLWGPDADEFRPERFQGRRHGWDFLPFAAGPRICLGQQMAIITASYVIVRLLQRYEEIEGTEEEMVATMGDRLGLTSAPDRGPMVRMREAEV
ncbi:hypothetical protein MBLNU457_g2829t1 [Dothideomycetes sp. NU457]